MNVELFALGRQYFEIYSRELDEYDIQVSPDIALKQGKHLIPYYDLKDSNIYLSNFDPSNPAGKLQLFFIRSILNCATNEEFFEFYRLIMPWMIGHELGHHLRQHYGLFGKNLWKEEQNANYLAFALTKHRFTPQERSRLQQLLRRAIEGLSRKMQAANIATVSYSNVLYALQVSGELDEEAVQNMEMMQRVFAVDPENMLIHSGQLSNEAVDQLQQRDEVISNINEVYTSDITRYLYYHLGWLYLGLTSREAYYVDEFAKVHLQHDVELLSSARVNIVPTEPQIQAYYQASVRATPFSETAAHYFYKRYRMLLMARLQSIITAQGLKEEAVLLLESWKYGDFDTLNYLSEIVPPDSRHLLPNEIAGRTQPHGDFGSHFISETDRRLWRSVMHRAEDAAAANTLKRLALLDRTDIYRVLSAEVAMEVIHDLRSVKLAKGEVIIRQGDMNYDVFILSEGRLGVTNENQQSNFLDALANNTEIELSNIEYLNYIEPGQVIGEVAFFTREARNATVLAVEPSVCYVLKASVLQLFAYNDPAVLMQMAGALAHRLTDMLRKHDHWH